MHILHGTWLPERRQFALWGEDTTAEPQYRKGRRGNLAPHPFAIPHAAWIAYLEQFTTEPHPDRGRSTIWLPGKGKYVQASPEAQASGVKPLEGDLDLLAWEIDVVLLRPTDAVDLFLQLPETSGRGFRLGHDLRFWQQAGLLAINSLVEGRYIPALSQQGKQYRAHWEAKPDPILWRQTAGGMPPLCRAITGDLEDLKPPLDLLNHFLSTAVDAFIREHYRGHRLPVTPWLRALTGLDPVVKDTTAKNKSLYTAWENWRAAGGEGGGAFKICFRLSEPAAEGGRWQIDYLLQAHDDPSLLVEAEAVWEAKSERLDYLEHRFHRPAG